MTPDTFLIIGLGNPGREYKDNRHNFGFMLIDRLAVRLNARGMKLQSKAIVTNAIYEERKLILAKPQTYMNLSVIPCRDWRTSINYRLKICWLRMMTLTFHSARFACAPAAAPADKKAWRPPSSDSAPKILRVCASALAVRPDEWIPPRMSCKIFRATI